VRDARLLRLNPISISDATPCVVTRWQRRIRDGHA
jgi:hypothetical protein